MSANKEGFNELIRYGVYLCELTGSNSLSEHPLGFYLLHFLPSLVTAVCLTLTTSANGSSASAVDFHLVLPAYQDLGCEFGGTGSSKTGSSVF